MKIKNLLLLTVFLLPFLKGQGQHFHCVHDSLMHIRKQQNPHIDKWENEKIKEFKNITLNFPTTPSHNRNQIVKCVHWILTLNTYIPNTCCPFWCIL